MKTIYVSGFRNEQGTVIWVGNSKGDPSFAPYEFKDETIARQRAMEAASRNPFYSEVFVKKETY